MPAACLHFVPGPYPFDVEVVLDAWLGITDALVRCRTCRQRYLMTLFDWVEPDTRERHFTLRAVDDDVFARFSRNTSRDYCDLTRKSAEVAALTAASPLLDVILRLDVSQQTLLTVAPAGPGLPTESWRKRLT